MVSKDTWKKVWYFTRAKDPSELKRKITKDDIVPIILSIIVAIGVVIALSYFFKAIFRCFKR